MAVAVVIDKTILMEFMFMFSRFAFVSVLRRALSGTPPPHSIHWSSPVCLWGYVALSH
jgi:hypothetical protein